MGGSPSAETKAIRPEKLGSCLSLIKWESGLIRAAGVSSLLSAMKGRLRAARLKGHAQRPGSVWRVSEPPVLGDKPAEVGG